jgi:hypothetical protein
MAFQYQLALLGDYGAQQALLTTRLLEQLDDLGVDRSQFRFFAEQELSLVDPKAPLVATFFGYNGARAQTHASLAKLISDSTTIIPCVDDLQDASSKLPTTISHINAFEYDGTDQSIVRLATLILENFRLLRSERRVFISYKRNESQSIAIQLYEALDRAGFDAFLDTRSVPPASDFQSVLWHRMADSDIVILLDTPSFRQSHWTQLELSQANATNIQILHLLWPSVQADPSSAFSEFDKLQASDFRSSARTGARPSISEKAIRRIIAKAESLRARALAARHRSLIDNFCDLARDHKARAIAVQPERYIALELAHGDHVAVVPMIGIPRADRYQEIDTALREKGNAAKKLWLLYDERGILQEWLAHLDWLNSHLPVVSVQVSNCTDRLQGAVR